MRFLAGCVFLPLALIATVSGAVRAQSDDDLPSLKPSGFSSDLRFYLSVGGFAPLGNLVGASNSSYGGTVSAGLQWGRPKTSHPFTGGIFYEAAGLARSIPSPYDSPFYSDGVAEAFTMEGGGLDGMFYLSPGKAARLYVGGGIGLFQVKRKLVSSDNGFSAVFSNDELESEFRLNPGFRSVVGVEIGRGFFAEGRYLNAGTMDGIRFQGYSISAGFRY